MPVRFDVDGDVAVVTIDRPARRNAVDGATAAELANAFRRFDADHALKVAILTGASGVFCAGYDLKAVATAEVTPARVEPAGAREADGPMGPTFMLLTKPVIAAVEGYAVAGGLELALWCDLRVAARDAVFGVYCRRWGVPLMDGGTVRLPRLIGHSRALDMILTGRGVSGDEALNMGLANRLVEPGGALDAAKILARELTAFPQGCLRSDRLSSYDQWGMTQDDAITNETRRGRDVIRSGETREGAQRFADGHGRHGRFDDLGTRAE